MIQDIPIAKPLFLPGNCLRSHPLLIALVASSGTDTTLHFRFGLMGPTSSIREPEPQTLSTAFHSRTGIYMAKLSQDNQSLSQGFQWNCSVQFSCSVVSDSLQPHGQQHTRSPSPLPTPGVYSNSCPLSR